MVICCCGMDGRADDGTPVTSVIAAAIVALRVSVRWWW